MNIKTLMDYLSGDAGASDKRYGRSSNGENIIYIENPRLETDSGSPAGKELLTGGTGWADQSIGDILVAEGKLSAEDVERIMEHQRHKGMYFGDAAVDLGLLSRDDILRALSTQFGYTYGWGDEIPSDDMVMAGSPFGELAEEFRSIRGRLLNNWLTVDNKTLMIVSPGRHDGRSYVAANLAMAFSQLGRPTLLIDADLRAPRQHEIFRTTSRIGLSKLLTGRVRVEDLDVLPDKVSAFQNLSVLGCGAIPPNPSELLSNGRFSPILRELKKHFDVIIIDAPSLSYQADVISTASVAGDVLLVARRGCSRMDDVKSLISLLRQAKANVVGSVLNEY